MEAESRLVIARSEEGKTKRVKVIKRHTLPVMRKLSSRDVIHNTVTTVNKTELYV